MLKSILLFSLFSSTLASAYSPSLESLLRNGSNPDVGTNSIVTKLNISEQKDMNLEVGANLTEEVLIKNLALKYLVYNEKENFPRIIQLEYKGGSAATENLVDFNVWPFHKLNGLTKNKEKVEARAFYSVLNVLLRNDAKLLMEFLKEHDIDVKSNRELVNKDKLRLLKKYRDYLVLVKEDNASGVENPMRPADEEKRAKVLGLKRAGFLEKDSSVKQVKDRDDFFWVVEKDNFFAKFDSDHKLKELTIKTAMGQLEFIFGKFVIFRNSIELPEYFMFKNLTGKQYKIKFSSLRSFQDNSDSYYRRLKRYTKQKEKNNISEPVDKPSFVL